MKKVIKKKLPTKKVISKKPVVQKAVKKPSKKGWLVVLAIANLLAFAAVIAINYLAVNLPIGGMTTGALADLYPNLFTPAGLTFSIWGLIYIAILGFVIRQLIDLFKKQSKGITKKIGIWFLLSCAANIGWIFAWHNQKILLSVIIILLFLITMIVIGNRVSLGKKLGTMGDKLLVQVPFSIYLGWICVATVANITALLVNIGWGMRGMTDIFWTITMISIVTLLTLRNLYKKHNIIFALVIIRAFIGIIIKRLAIDPIYAKSILRTLGIGIAIITAGIGAKWNMWRKN